MSKSNQFQKIKNKNRINKVETGILLGNGINLLAEGITWAGLLNRIAQEMNVFVEINNNKTFPMIFEEILFKSEGDFYNNLKNIKEHIANEYLITWPNHFPQSSYDFECNRLPYLQLIMIILWRKYLNQILTFHV